MAVLHFRYCLFWENFVCLINLFRIFMRKWCIGGKPDTNLRLKLNEESPKTETLRETQFAHEDAPTHHTFFRIRNTLRVSASLREDSFKNLRSHQYYYIYCVSSRFSHPQSGN